MMTEDSTTLFRFTMTRPARRAANQDQLALRPEKVTLIEEQIIAARKTKPDQPLTEIVNRFMISANAMTRAKNRELFFAARTILSKLELIAKSSDFDDSSIANVFADSDWDSLVEKPGADVIENQLWSTLIVTHLISTSSIEHLLDLTRTLRVLLISQSENQSANLQHIIRAPLALPIDRIKKSGVTIGQQPKTTANSPENLLSLKNSLKNKQLSLGKDILAQRDLVKKLRNFLKTAPKTKANSTIKLNSANQQNVVLISDSQAKSLSATELAYIKNEGGASTAIPTLIYRLENKVNSAVKNLELSLREIKNPRHSTLTLAHQSKMVALSQSYISDNPLTNELANVLAKLDAPILLNLFPGITIPQIESTDTTTEKMRSSMRPLGVLDLKLVSTKLKNYQLGEVAHIENVLATEYRKRSHHRQDFSEDTVLNETEVIQERQHDLETNERFSLHQEVQRSINEQMQVTAGVQVNAYGAGFSVGANAGFSYNRGEQFAQKQSSDIAKEIVDKTRERVESRVREQRQSVRRVTVDESNVHRFDNTGPESSHKVGIYRFVNQVLEAKLLNYGRRLMFEFMVPEPAAALRVLESRSSAKPERLAELTLQPAELDETNYQNLAGLYGAKNFEPPPEKELTLTALLKEGESAAAGDASAVQPVVLSAEIDLPLGYKVESVSMVNANGGADSASVHVTESAPGWYQNRVGGAGYYSRSAVTNSMHINKIAAWIMVDPAKTAIATVYIKCLLLDSHWQRWQNETYAKIKEAYEIKLDDIAEKNRQLEAKQRRGIKVANQEQNRRLEREELARGCISLFNSRLLSGDYFDSVSLGDAGLTIDVDDALREGQVVRFFHSAFEWDNMTYELFPYFWGNRSRWDQMQSASHEDPKFEAFLRSGFARVLVPVRPGQETNVINAITIGLSAVFDGARETVIDDPDFLELLADVDVVLDPPVQEGDVWDVVVPTSLIKLQLQGEEGGIGIVGTE